MEPSLYPYLTQLQGLRSSSILQLAGLSSINAQYRHHSPDYRTRGSTNSSPFSPAQRQLQGYQRILNARANPYAAEGQHYLALTSGAQSPLAQNPKLGALIVQLQSQGFANSPYTGDGSRYVIANIDLSGDSTSDIRANNYLNPLGSPPLRGRQYRLHYYQDRSQEVIFLQDVSTRSISKSLAEITRGTLHHLNRKQNLLGTTYPTLYGSGQVQTAFDYNPNQDLILTRKAGDTRYQATSIDRTTNGFATTATCISTFLSHRLGKMTKAHQIQKFVDDALEANSEFVITTPRSQINLDKIRKNSKNLIDFFPGLRQGFGLSTSSADIIAASQIFVDHMRAKYVSRAQEPPENIARAYQNAGINPALYRDYSTLTNSRTHSMSLPTTLPYDKTTTRSSHLLADGVLQFSNFQTVLSDSQGALDNNARYRIDSFQAEHSLVVGRIGLIDTPKRQSAPLAPPLSTTREPVSLGFTLVGNLANSILSSLGSIVNVVEVKKRANQKLGIASGLSGTYQVLLQGNIDVSSSLLNGLRDVSGLGKPGLYTIDVALIGQHFSNNIDINWHPTVTGRI
ncbi:MAG: hypothetical protein HRT36_07475 [Alphaproteobacteria bacterium]|nr:hypothetical protein [Alphaproteobacteria bacterium]